MFSKSLETRHNLLYAASFLSYEYELRMEEIDIYRTANLIIKQFGGHAALEAISRVERYEAFGDKEGAQVRERILAAIKWLQIPGNATQGTAH